MDQSIDRGVGRGGLVASPTVRLWGNKTHKEASNGQPHYRAERLNTHHPDAPEKA